MGYAGAFAANALARPAMGRWLERVLFSDARAALPLPWADYPSQQVALDAANFQVFSYYIANEVRSTYSGMMIAVPEVKWEEFETQSAPELSRTLLRLAANVNPARLRKHPRKPKKKTKKGYHSQASRPRGPHQPDCVGGGLVLTTSRQTHSSCSPVWLEEWRS